MFKINKKIKRRKDSNLCLKRGVVEATTLSNYAFASTIKLIFSVYMLMNKRDRKYSFLFMNLRRVKEMYELKKPQERLFYE